MRASTNGVVFRYSHGSNYKRCCFSILTRQQLQSVLFFDTHTKATTNGIVFRYSHDSNYKRCCFSILTRQQLQTVLFFDTHTTATTNSAVFRYSHGSNYKQCCFRYSHESNYKQFCFSILTWEQLQTVLFFRDLCTRVGSGDIPTLYFEYKTECSEIIWNRKGQMITQMKHLIDTTYTNDNNYENKETRNQMTQLLSYIKKFFIK